VAEHGEEARRWRAAVARAGTVAARSGAVDENSWDEVAIRDIIAVTLHALASRGRTPVAEVGWDVVLWQLNDADRVRALVDLIASDEPAGLAERWAWLERVWNPHAPFRAHMADLSRARSPMSAVPGDDVEPRWGGMTRGIARGLPDPALEIGLLHAAGAVGRELLTACSGLAHYARVAVIGGQYKGDAGYVRGPVWELDDERETVTTPPCGYEVSLDQDTAVSAPVIEASFLRVLDDGLTWAQRPAGSAALLPPAFAPAPEPDCAEHLASILSRSTNPQIVPEELRMQITASARYAPRLIEHRAAARPTRRSWRATEHRFVPAAQADGFVSVFEVEFTRSVFDRDPVCVLALDESEILPIIAAHLGTC
jgi:hypothetical protein